MRRALALLVAPLLFSAAFAQVPEATVRAGDVLGVVVVGQPAFTGDYTVLDDGSITGVGFGRLQVEGKTLADIRAAITGEMGKRLRQPIVEVVLRSQRPLVVYVIGNAGANRQEPVRLAPHMDLRQLLGHVGLPDSPELLDLRVSRRGEPTRTIDVLKLLRGEDEWNGPLLADDVVAILPKTFKVTVSGEVNEPGEYVVRNTAQLAGAVAAARGITKEGTLEGVVVFRGPDVFQVDASGAANGKAFEPFMLESGDLIVVRRSERAVYAIGEVRNPGRYVVPDGKDYTAADLLAAAQGLSERGTLRRVTLLRPGQDGKYTAARFNLDEFLKDAKTDANPKLQSGDVLLFGEPRGVNLGETARILSSVFTFSRIAGR